MLPIKLGRWPQHTRDCSSENPAEHPPAFAIIIKWRSSCREDPLAKWFRFARSGGPVAPFFLGSDGMASFSLDRHGDWVRPGEGRPHGRIGEGLASFFPGTSNRRASPRRARGSLGSSCREQPARPVVFWMVEDHGDWGRNVNLRGIGFVFSRGGLVARMAFRAACCPGWVEAFPRWE